MACSNVEVSPLSIACDYVQICKVEGGRGGGRGRGEGREGEGRGGKGRRGGRGEVGGEGRGGEGRGGEGRGGEKCIHAVSIETAALK